MKFRFTLKRIGLLLCLVACTACALHKKKKSAPMPLHQMVGNIVLVNDKLGFVLIDTGNAAIYPSKGQALKSFTNGHESGVLTVSPEHKPPFLIGDIVTGTPLKGDQVFQ